MTDKSTMHKMGFVMHFLALRRWSSVGPSRPQRRARKEQVERMGRPKVCVFTSIARPRVGTTRGYCAPSTPNRNPTPNPNRNPSHTKKGNSPRSHRGTEERLRGLQEQTLHEFWPDALVRQPMDYEEGGNLATIHATLSGGRRQRRSCLSVSVPRA